MRVGVFVWEDIGEYFDRSETGSDETGVGEDGASEIGESEIREAFSLLLGLPLGVA